MKLLVNGLLKFTCGLIMVGLLIFLPAGTLAYGNGWLFMGLLFVPMLIAGFVMFLKAPALLARRLDVKEKQGSQKGVVALSGLMFLAGFVVAGLDFRFGWSKMPPAVVIAASVLFLVMYALYGEVLRENAYLSRTVKVEAEQTVVDTGLYGIVRHRPASDVYGNDPAVFDDASCFGVVVCPDRVCLLPGDHPCPAERGGGTADPGASRLRRV